MLYLARLVCCFDHSVSLGERLVDITYAAVVRSRDVMQYVAVQRELIDHLALSLVTGELGIVFVKIVRRARVVLHSAVMHQRSPLRHGLLDRKYGPQRLVFHFDEFPCLYRFFERLSDDSGHTVADVPDFFVEKLPVMRRRFRVALSG